MGAHKVLQGLHEDGLVSFEDIASGRGRPRRAFKLNAAGHARFPDRHADVTVELIENVRTLFGEAGLEKLILARETQQLVRYPDLSGQGLEQKMERLAEIRTDEGYMARVESGATGDFLFIEDHCPICAAAAKCRGFCRSEMAIFESVLGSDVKITREEHALSGSRRCAYRITAL